MVHVHVGDLVVHDVPWDGASRPLCKQHACSHLPSPRPAAGAGSSQRKKGSNSQFCPKSHFGTIGISESCCIIVVLFYPPNHDIYEDTALKMGSMYLSVTTLL